VVRQVLRLVAHHHDCGFAAAQGALRGVGRVNPPENPLGLEIARNWLVAKSVLSLSSRDNHHNK
jgi:hypothetical protein